MATTKPPTVVIKAIFIPFATRAGLISPATSIASKATIKPTTVPRNPSIGASEINRPIQLNPFSSKLACTPP